MSTLSLTTWFDQIPGGLLVTDLTSRVLYANQAVERRTGFSVAEIIGKKPGELWGGRMSYSFYQLLWQRIGDEGKPFVGRFQNQPKGKSRQWETLQIAPVKNQDGETEYFLEIHPQFRSEVQEHEFHRRFLSEAESWHQAPSSWQRFLEMLQSSDADKSLTIVPTRQLDLTQFLREELILPAQAGLARRFEDRMLVQSAQQDPAAFAFLYEKYGELVRQYFLRRLSSHDEAEDLAQEVFVRAFRALPRFRVANASYYTYLLHVAHNLLVDYYRGVSKATVQNHAALDEVMSEGGAPDLETLNMLLSSLSTGERLVMLLTYRDGYRAREVAEKLGKTENAVKLILSRSRKKLRSVLA